MAARLDDKEAIGASYGRVPRHVLWLLGVLIAILAVMAAVWLAIGRTPDAGVFKGDRGDAEGSRKSRQEGPHPDGKEGARKAPARAPSARIGDQRVDESSDDVAGRVMEWLILDTSVSEASANSCRAAISRILCDVGEEFAQRAMLDEDLSNGDERVYLIPALTDRGAAAVAQIENVIRGHCGAIVGGSDGLSPTETYLGGLGKYDTVVWVVHGANREIANIRIELRSPETGDLVYRSLGGDSMWLGETFSKQYVFQDQ